MESSARQNEPNILDEGARVDKARYRPIRLIGLLLILQVIGLGVSASTRLLGSTGTRS